MSKDDLEGRGSDIGPEVLADYLKAGRHNRQMAAAAKENPMFSSDGATTWNDEEVLKWRELAAQVPELRNNIRVLGACLEAATARACAAEAKVAELFGAIAVIDEKLGDIVSITKKQPRNQR